MVMIQIIDYKVMYMGEFIIFDKEKADYLLSIGFLYTERMIDGHNCFVFIQSKELANELNSNFDKSDFITNPVVCF